MLIETFTAHEMSCARFVQGPEKGDQHDHLPTRRTTCRSGGTTFHSSFWPMQPGAKKRPWFSLFFDCLGGEGAGCHPDQRLLRDIYPHQGNVPSWAARGTRGATGPLLAAIGAPWKQPFQISHNDLTFRAFEDFSVDSRVSYGQGTAWYRAATSCSHPRLSNGHVDSARCQQIPAALGLSARGAGSGRGTRTL